MASETLTSSNDSNESIEEYDIETPGDAESLEFSYEEDDDNVFDIDESDESDYAKKKNLSDFVTPMPKQFSKDSESLVTFSIEMGNINHRTSRTLFKINKFLPVKIFMSKFTFLISFHFKLYKNRNLRIKYAFF